MRWLVLAALATLLGWSLALGPSVPWAHAQAAAPTVVNVGPATPTSVKGQLGLSAKLTTADGRPLSGQHLDFYVPVELFGDREAYVGTATTDSAGGAALGYQPTQIGAQTIVARFAGTAAYAASEGRADIQVGEVVPPIKAEPLPFTGLRDWLPIGMLGLVVLVWGVLLGVFLGTVQGIRRAV